MLWFSCSLLDGDGGELRAMAISHRAIICYGLGEAEINSTGSLLMLSIWELLSHRASRVVTHTKYRVA